MSIKHILSAQNMDVFDEYFSIKSENTSSDSKESCIILGKDSKIISSLLFQAAVSIADDGDQVIFICPCPITEQPYFVSNMTAPSSLSLECIKMVYISEPSGLLQYLCEFHTKNSYPAAVIIDGIHYYVSHHSEDQRKESALVKLLALLEDTTSFITQKKGESCHRMVSLQSSLCPKNYLKRYFKELWHVSSGEGAGEYFMTDDSLPAFRCTMHLNEDNKIITDNMFRLMPVTESS